MYALSLSSSLIDLNADEQRIYIDEDELCCEQDAFWIHIGGNQWIHTDSVYRDSTGLYTKECSIARGIDKTTPKPDHKKPTYEKKWKCPFCYHYYTWGSKCDNDNCPSKFK